MNEIAAVTAAYANECSTGRDVLITDFDLFRSLGGGQTVYHRIIAQRPQDRFYYFLRAENPGAVRPANAFPVPYVAEYRAVPEHLPKDQRHLLWAYRDARNLAQSIVRHLPGQGFDVVDVPDYCQHGVFIRSALEAEGVACGSVVVAMHGTLSAAWAAGWPAPGDGNAQLDESRLKEDLQFRAADARYAISASYAAEWESRLGLKVNLVDPMSAVGNIEAKSAIRPDGPPDLAFIGRREKWKGPDLFLDLAWCLDRSLYRRLLIAGPEGPNRLGIGSAGFLTGMARLRKLQPEILGSIPRDEVQRLLAGRTVLLLPSRHDTFNLTALEALAAGCPVLLSRHAGVAQWLLRVLPELNWLVVDIDCARTAASATADLLRNYDSRRDALVAAMRRLPRARPTAFDDIYRPSGAVDLDARQTVVELAAHFAALAQLAPRSSLMKMVRQPIDAGRFVAGLVAPLTPRFVSRPLRRLAVVGGRASALMRDLNRQRRGGLHWAAKETIRQAVNRYAGLSPRTFLQIDRSSRWDLLRRQMLVLPEFTEAEARLKLLTLSRRINDHLVNRVPLFREMGRLERRLGNDLVAATYALRVMRWLGRDNHGDLAFVRATLEANGFHHEAATAEALFGRPDLSEGRCLALMQAARERNLVRADLPLAAVDDRRGNTPRKVSVIVSLYNAADKLPTLLGCLAQQTIAQRGELEVVLVDSNSPADEHAAMEAFLAHTPLPVVYARSAGRETIQKAWNRGIGLARAPYLAFLGADEGLHPDALRQLAAALDADPGADWAMADSLVTDVDAAGVYAGDVMPYDRTGYRQDLVYLETCYLSWVGGLYRRSIHERFGYYDETYRAAGDTEFKNRVMPYIRSVHVPRMLGVFNNYPEERTTAHPRAEIEDLRAWYLWRSPAGMRYAFADRPAEDAVALLRTALNYRKSFCGHLSSDFDLADALARYLGTRPDVSPEWAAQAQHATAEALAILRGLEQLPRRISSRLRGVNYARHVYGLLMGAKRDLAARHQQVFELPQRPHYELFNDNRYEQHWWSWSGS